VNAAGKDNSVFLIFDVWCNMKIFLNGKEKYVDGDISNLDELIGSIMKSEKGKIIEFNGKVVKKEERGNISLKDGDRIEMIQFMGGG